MVRHGVRDYKYCGCAIKMEERRDEDCKIHIVFCVAGFGCGVGGSVIDFVMRMYGLTPLEAAKKLNTDFRLGLFDYKPTKEEQRIQAQQRADKGLTKAFEGYMSKAYNLLCDYAHLLREWKETHAPKSIEDMNEPNALFVEACHRLDYTEYLIDCLMYADMDEQINFYETYREELISIAERIKSYTESRKADKSA